MKPGTVAVGYLDDEHWSASFGLCMRDLLLVDLTRGNQRIVPNGVELRKVCSTGGIASGRNEVARQMLDETECEYLWTIDTDMGFGPLTVETLIDSLDAVGELAVIGGLCFSIQGAGRGEFYSVVTTEFPTVYDWRETETIAGFEPRCDYERDTLTRCDATGAACMLIPRVVLERMREQFGDNWYSPIPHPKTPNSVFGEDLSFCMRLAALDVPLFVNTAVKTTHHKGEGRFLSETTYDRQLISTRAEAEGFFTVFGELWRRAKFGGWSTKRRLRVA